MATNPQQSADTALTGDRPAVDLAGFEEMREEADAWRVEWADGSERETTITAMAWYARGFDDDATVTPL